MEEEVVIGRRYCLGPKIGAGSFGEIYRAADVQTGEQVAAKLETKDTKHAQLKYEYSVYESIKKGTGFPNIRYFGSTDKHNVMVMDLLGSSLEALFSLCSRKFSLKTVLMLAIQLIDRVEFLHGNNFAHRDIKPDNFLVGGTRLDCHVVYMVDMGLCKLYRDPKSKRHIPYRINKKLTGTPRYASIHTHNGEEQSRRDDLESLGYMLMYFNHGKLPWQGLKARTKQEKYDLIGKTKRETTLETLCKGLPEEFLKYMEYCTNLKFDEEPDYYYLKNLFYDLVKSKGYVCDWVFDWDDLPAHELYLKSLESQQNIPVTRSSVQMVSSSIPNPQHLLATISRLESENDKLRVQNQQYKLLYQKAQEDCAMLKNQILAMQVNQIALPTPIRFYGTDMRGSSPNQVGIIPQGQIVTNASSNISPHHGDVVVLGELSNISQNKSLAKQEASKRQRIDTSVITTGVLVSSSDSQENDRRKLGRI